MDVMMVCATISRLLPTSRAGQREDLIEELEQ
jgi:hypothetical protein